MTGEEQVYIVDPDATNQQLVYNNSEVGQWSPDGTRIALVTQLGPPQVLLFNVNNGSSVYFGLPFDRYPDLGALLHGVVTGRRQACVRRPRPDGSEPDRRLHSAVIGRATCRGHLGITWVTA